MKLSSLFRKRNSSKNSTNLNQTQKFYFKNFGKRLAKNAGTALIYALIFSMPIYINILIYLSIDSQSKQITVYLPYINTIFALFAIASVLSVDKKYRFFFGFFVGILWFYWTNLSFRFTPSPYLMWVGIFGVAVGYGIVFYFLLFFNNKIFRIVSLALIGLIPILGFDWLVVESLFSFSILRVDKISFILIMVCITIGLYFLQQARISKEHKSKKLNLKRAGFALIPLIFVVDFSHTEVEIPQNIYVAQMNISQNAKWNEREHNMAYNFRHIDEAIAQGAKVVILPETTFPVRLNMRRDLMERLLELSHQITIIAGAQRGEISADMSENIVTFNSTFVFEKGQWRYTDKIFLAPFGEYAPIPKIFADFFKKLFNIDIMHGFARSVGIHNDMETEYFSFRAAICYEATTRGAFEGNPKIMIAISNSAWFAPSIEPVLQIMLMKYYARIYKTLIIQSANGSKSLIITPNVSLKFIANN